MRNDLSNSADIHSVTIRKGELAMSKEKEKNRETKADKRQAKREGRSIKQQLEIAHAGWLAQLKTTTK
tara:strand:+ start:436 stop:639 length:204 start_codon:yes stop_codon:yes gene_type:complete